MVSVLASMAAVKFATVIPPKLVSSLPHFDCRVFQLPSREEVANAFLWRAMDARKNAISMVAQANFSHRQLFEKSQKDMLAMLSEKEIDFEAYPASFKQGTFVRRVTVLRGLSPAELARIPEAHRPTAPVMRSEMAIIDIPPFNKVTNRAAVIFDAVAPSVTPRNGQ